jgi:hypothetical protein
MTQWCSPCEDLGTSNKRFWVSNPLMCSLTWGAKQELVGRVCYCAFFLNFEDLDEKWKIVHV